MTIADLVARFHMLRPDDARLVVAYNRLYERYITEGRKVEARVMSDVLKILWRIKSAPEVDVPLPDTQVGDL